MDKKGLFSDLIGTLFPLVSFFHFIFKTEKNHRHHGYKSLSRLFLLTAIENKNLHTVAELATFFNLKKSTLSELLSRMENDRLLVRQINLADRRQYIFRLTPQAKKILKELEKSFQKRLQVFLCRMSESRRQKFLDALEDITQSLSFINCQQEDDYD